MTKTDYKVRIILLFVAAGILAALMLTSCNHVKKVLKDTAKMQQVFDKGVELGWCVNDSVYVSDTTILLDTLHVIESTTDTLKVDSVVYITKTDYKTIHKTITIRDTTVVTDRTKENLLQNKLINKTGELLKKVEELEQSKSETREARKQRNDWRLRTWILGIAFIVWLLRKPILKLISPIKL